MTITAPDLAPAKRNEETSAGKALALLDAFSGQLTVVGVTDLAARANIPKSTAHRLLNVMVSCGYVRRVRDRYCLTDHMFEMGNQVRSCRPSGVRDVAAPYLAELFAETRQTVQLATLVGTEVLYLDKVAGRYAVPCPTRIGSRRPAYATALGKALVAFASVEVGASNLQVPFQRFTRHTVADAAQFQLCLDQVRDEGVAIDQGELRVGVNCVAAPVLDSRTGEAIAAVSICSSSPTVIKRYQRTLARTADELSRHYFTAS